MKPLILILAFLCIAASPRDVTDTLIRMDRLLGDTEALGAVPTLKQDGRVTSGFGRPRPGHKHAGLDIVNAPGTPIRAVGGGTVTHSGWEPGGYGINIVVHYGNLDVLYGHLRLAYVRVGDKVKRGQVIGEMGATGRCSPVGATHLHLEYRINGVPCDPMRFIIGNE